jgi:adenylylsulfate kinase-like enzyme
MIICFTGQPNSGKTTLANELKKHFVNNSLSCEVLDGDILRSIYNNTDYTIFGRKRNVSLAFDLAKKLSNEKNVVIVSLVSPFREIRELLKNDSNFIVKEIFLHSTRKRDGRMVIYYEPPLKNYLEIDTDKHNVVESLNLVINYIK